ncbi:MAG TPA: aminotransferase class III-fold pyridoxal phosphate-dependent enzyme [Gammaproteobacteria bacterium]|nr:aminotransferase class III-fold pyridoxal phosphate-dependent enzyme [Gammaproteobacteria bacterium]
MSSGQKLYAKARRLIPGGTQLLSKRPEMFLPDQWPAYYSRAKGADVWDLDGRKYTDVSNSGISSCVLGFADPELEEAVIGAVKAGPMTTLNCPEEVELAELLIELHPWAEMVRYARSGGEIMAIAARIARAATGRDKIAFCGYHGWHDWYLAANLSADTALDGHLLSGLKPAGVPRGLTGTMLPFRYNKIEELRQIVAEFGPELAAIVMEPMRSTGPAPGFLEEVRALATRIGAVLVFDEVTSGWRLNCGGIHMVYGVHPDLAAFAKAMSNGYAMAAVVGVRGVMEAAQTSFISSTFWTEKIGPVAALASIRKYRREAVHEHQVAVGKRVQQGWLAAADAAGLKIKPTGIPPLSNFSFDHPDADALATLFTQEMLDRGYLAAPRFNSTLAHTRDLVERYLGNTNEVFSVLADAIRRDEVGMRLRGPVRHSDFQRLA